MSSAGRAALAAVGMTDRSLAFSDPGPMARLEDVKADESAPSVVFQRLCERETLGQIAKAWGLPKGRFVEWYTTEHASLYDAALKVLADEVAHEALEVSDGPPRQAVNAAGEPLVDAEGNPMLVEPDVQRDRLRVDTRLKLASKWDRKRYGEEVDGVRLTPVVIQIANLRGDTKVEVSAPALPPETI